VNRDKSFLNRYFVEFGLAPGNSGFLGLYFRKKRAKPDYWTLWQEISPFLTDSAALTRRG